MGSGASAVANNSSRKGEAEKPGDDYEGIDYFGLEVAL